MQASNKYHALRRRRGLQAKRAGMSLRRRPNDVIVDDSRLQHVLKTGHDVGFSFSSGKWVSWRDMKPAQLADRFQAQFKTIVSPAQWSGRGKEGFPDVAAVVDIGKLVTASVTVTADQMKITLAVLGDGAMMLSLDPVPVPLGTTYADLVKLFDARMIVGLAQMQSKVKQS